MKKIYYLIMSFFWINCSFSQQYQWKNVNLQGMGYVTGIIAHPLDHTIYARTDVGGIYKWEKINSTWLPLTDHKGIGYSIESFAVDPLDSRVIFIASEGHIFKSQDKGNSWKQCGNLTLTMNGNGSYRGSGERLSVYGDTIFYGSRSQGLWRSLDGGDTWKQISTNKIPAGSEAGILFTAIDPVSTNIVYAGVTGSGVYKSADGGDNWFLMSGSAPAPLKPIRIALALDGVYYITYASTDGEGITGSVKKGSRDSNVLIDVTPKTKASKSFWGISVDIHNSNKVAALQWPPANTNSVHFSIDGGGAWTGSKMDNLNCDEPDWYPTWASWTYSGAIMLDPDDSNKAWVTTGFAIYKTEDNTAPTPHWATQMNNFEELVAFTVKTPPLYGGATLLAGFGDMIGVRVEDPSQVPKKTFSPSSFGMITSIAYCEFDPRHIVVVGGDETGDASSQYEGKNAIYRFSKDNGVTWANFTKPSSKSVNGNIAISSTNPYRWVLAPKNREGWFDDPQYTTDGGKTWTLCSGLPANVENGNTQQWTGSEFLVADRVNGKKFYLYYDRGVGGPWTTGFFASDDGGATFVLKSSVLPGDWSTEMVSLPGKEGHILFVTKNNNGKGLFHTTDGGKTWRQIDKVSECKSVSVGKAIYPSVEPTIYIYGKVSGVKSVWRSTDYCKTWTNVGSDSAPIDLIKNIEGDMRDGMKVYAATGGRGILYGMGEPIPYVGVSGISDIPAEINVNLKETKLVNATVLPANATNCKLIWKSANSAIADVSPNGLIYGLSEGRTTITVTSDDGLFSASCNVVVSYALSTLDFKLSKKSKVYPNPFDLKENSLLNIETGLSNASNLMLYNISGKLLVHQAIETDQSGNFSYRLPDFIKQGLYLLYITGEKGNSHSKLLIR